MIALKSTQFQHGFFEKTGKGFPVFLLHGFAEDETIFENQIKELQSNYTVYTPHFNTLKTAQVITIDLLADFIFEICEQEKLDKIVLLGHSMGGYIALSYATKYAEKIKALGLLHSTAYSDDEAKIDTRKKAIRIIENEGKGIFLRMMIPNLYAGKYKNENPSIIEKHLSMAMEISSNRLIDFYKAMINRTDTTLVLKNATYPVLFVIGNEDMAVQYKSMLTQSVMPFFSKVIFFKDTGHTSMLEKTYELNGAINNFCKTVFDTNF